MKRLHDTKVTEGKEVKGNKNATGVRNYVFTRIIGLQPANSKKSAPDSNKPNSGTILGPKSGIRGPR